MRDEGEIVTDLESELRELFDGTRGAGSSLTDAHLHDVLVCAGTARRRRRRAALAGVAVATLVLAGGGTLVALGRGGPVRGLPAGPTTTAPVPATSSTTGAPAATYDPAGALVVGLLPATADLPVGVRRLGDPPRVLSGPEVKAFHPCHDIPSSATAALVDDQSGTADDVLALHIDLIRSPDEAGARTVVTQGLLAGGCGNGGIPMAAVPGTSVPTWTGHTPGTTVSSPVSIAAARVGSDVVLVSFFGDPPTARRVLDGIVTRLEGRAPLTPASALTPAPPPTTSRTGIPLDVVDAPEGHRAVLGVLKGGRTATVMGLQSCDAIAIAQGGGSPIGLTAVDGLMVDLLPATTPDTGDGPKPGAATVVVKRFAPGAGPTAWSQLLDDSGDCRWMPSVRTDPWAGHAEGRVVTTAAARGVVLRTGDYLVAASTTEGAELATLESLVDTVAQRVSASAPDGR